MNIIAGIDYSLTSPSIVVHNGESWRFENCKYYYMTKSDKNLVNDGIFCGSIYPTYTTEYERYQKIATWALKIVLDNQVSKCYIEGYAFAAVGRITQIAENTGLMKYSLWNMGVDFDIFAPTTIKKYATTKGNAKKDAMYEYWLLETGIDIRKKLNIKSEKMWNPVSDIVDAYYIAKLGYEKGCCDEDKTN